MAQPLSIREVAARVGLTGHTRRYYGRIGLMETIGRAANGHRRYTEADLEWVTPLHHLRSTGMPIRGDAAFRRAGAPWRGDDR